MRSRCPEVIIPINFYGPEIRERQTPAGDSDSGNPSVSSADALYPAEIWQVWGPIKRLNNCRGLAPINDSSKSSWNIGISIRICPSWWYSRTFHQGSLSQCRLSWFTLKVLLTVHYFMSALKLWSSFRRLSWRYGGLWCAQTWKQISRRPRTEFTWAWT